MNKIFVWVLFLMVFCIGCSRKAEEELFKEEPETVTEEAVPTNESKVVSQSQPVELSDKTAPQEEPFVKPDIKDIQTALKNAGFYEGNIDGILGPMTKKAIEEFQKENGLGVDGKVGPKTWAKLKPFLNSSSQ